MQNDEKFNFPVVILAGGLGTRLRSSVPDAPKALAPIGGRPFMFYLLRQLRAFGLSEVILSTSYRAGQIEQAIGPVFEGMAVKYSRETEPLGTGGGVKLALNGKQFPHALVINGDSFCEFNLANFQSAHLNQGADLTVLLTEVQDTSRFGRVEQKANGEIAAYLEKQVSGGAGWINAGLYFMAPGVVDSIPAGQAVSLERDIFPRWIGRKMFGYKNEGGVFIDIGTPESFIEAQEILTKKWIGIEGA